MNNDNGIHITVRVERPKIDPTRIDLSQRSFSLREGETIKLEASVYPDDATYDRVLWDAKGTGTSPGAVLTTTEGDKLNFLNITGSQAGTVTITAIVYKTDGKTEVKATCEVTVLPVEVSADSMTMLQGETRRVTINVTPPNAEVKIVQLQSDAPEVAFVGANVGGISSNEMVQAVGPGEATITVNLTVNGVPKNTSFKVKVTGTATDTPTDAPGGQT